MELMKRKLCFRITAKLENSKRQHCLWQERKKNNAGPTIQKSPWKEKKKSRRKDKEEEESFYSHMNRRNTSYAQGVECSCSF